MRARPIKPAPLVPIAGFLAGSTLGALVAFPRLSAVILAGLLAVWRAVVRAQEIAEPSRRRSRKGGIYGRLTRS